MKNRILPLILILPFTVTVFAADKSTPTGLVRDSVDKVVAILKDPSLDRGERWKKIGVIIEDRFDFRTMSQSVLATNWKKATPEERKSFVEFFSQYIEATYRNRIESYTNQEVIITGETIRGTRAIVETRVVTDTTEIPVDYKLKNNNGTWYAYDVVIEGVSLVNNYRSTFAAIVNNEGMEGLLDDIQKRVDKYRQENEGESSGI